LTKLNKKILFPSALVIVFLAFAAYGGSSAFAQSVSDYPPIVQKISQRFNLKESDVEELFAQERADMWNNRRRSLSDSLDLAVKDGKITNEQKQMILDKKDAMRADMEAERQTKKEELTAWMKDNGIDATLLMPYFGFGNSGRMHGRGWMMK
jgi:hypothetical protein